MKTEKKRCAYQFGLCLSTGTWFWHTPLSCMCAGWGGSCGITGSQDWLLWGREIRVCACVCSAEGKAICTQLSLTTNTHEQKHNRAWPSQACNVSMRRTCRSVSGFMRHRASHSLVSPQLVAGLVKRGYPSTQTPMISRTRQGRLHLP